MEARLYADGEVPDYTTAEWYAQRDRAPHLEEFLHGPRLRLAADMVNDAIARSGVSTVSDMGCGDGGLLTLVRGAQAWGYDLQPSNVAGGRERGADVRLGSIFDPDIAWGELTVCTECLEHLLDPHGFVASVPSRMVVASSPVTETAEHHYPFHTWAWDRDGYRTMFENAGYRVERHEETGMFQVLLAVRT